jgi:hypothetical protein
VLRTCIEITETNSYIEDKLKKLQENVIIKLYRESLYNNSAALNFTSLDDASLVHFI